MLEIAQALYLTDILHAVAQGLLAPVIIVLLAFVVYAVFLIGSVIVEAVTERRNFRIVISKFLTSIACAKEEDLADVVIDSGLLRRQKVSLLTLWSYRSLPSETLETLAKRLLAIQELRYGRITGRTDAPSAPASLPSARDRPTYSQPRSVSPSTPRSPALSPRASPTWSAASAATGMRTISARSRRPCAPCSRRSRRSARLVL